MSLRYPKESFLFLLRGSPTLLSFVQLLVVLASSGGVACSRVPCAGVLYLGESAGLHMPPKIRKASKDSPMSSSSSETVVNSATSCSFEFQEQERSICGSHL